MRSGRKVRTLIVAGVLVMGGMLLTAQGTIFSAPEIEYQSPMSLVGVAAGSGLFVALDSSGLVLLSTNGVAWEQHRLSSDGIPESITYGNGRFLIAALSRNGNGLLAYVSPDGRDWK